MTPEQTQMAIVASLGGLLLVYIVVTIILIVRTSKLEKKYRAFMKGSSGTDLESTILNRFAEIDKLKVEERLTAEKLELTCESLLHAFQKIGLVKYDAFSEMGGKLSYSLCLLNDEDNGIIITSIHSREGCNSYIKEIIRGQSYVIMSNEERQALDIAQKGRQYVDLQ